MGIKRGEVVASMVNRNTPRNWSCGFAGRVNAHAPCNYGNRITGIHSKRELSWHYHRQYGFIGQTLKMVGIKERDSDSIMCRFGQ